MDVTKDDEGVWLEKRTHGGYVRVTHTTFFLVLLLTTRQRKVYNARHEGIFHGVGRGAVLQAPDMANRLMSEGWGIAFLKFHNQEEGKRK